jgi:hypothetical protein
VRAALVGLFAVGCAMPQYASQPVAFGTTSTPFEQARAICAPRARIASDQARATMLDRAAPSPYVATMNAQTAAQRAGDDTYSSCLAEHGWRVERHCTQNCR